MTYPAYLPTDRRYVHGEWPVSRHKFMSNAEQRVLHATAKTGQELRLTYAIQTTEVVQEFLYHYDAMYGMQYAFELPKEVYTGWDGNKNLLGRKQFWQYKDVPRITSQKGRIATLQVTLVVATTQAIRSLTTSDFGPGSGDGGDNGGGDNGPSPQPCLIQVFNAGDQDWADWTINYHDIKIIADAKYCSTQQQMRFRSETKTDYERIIRAYGIRVSQFGPAEYDIKCVGATQSINS